MSVDAFLPRRFQRTNADGISPSALALFVAIALLMLLTLPEVVTGLSLGQNNIGASSSYLYLLFGLISNTMVISFISAGVLAYSVHKSSSRNSLRAMVLSAAGFVSPLLMAYWLGFVGIFLELAVVAFGLPIYYWSGAATKMARLAWAARLAALAQLLAVAGLVYYGYYHVIRLPTLWSFTVFWVCMNLVLFAPPYLLSRIDVSIASELKAAPWVGGMILLTFFVSYFGEFGPYPVLQFPVDELLVLFSGFVLFAMAVHSVHGKSEVGAVLVGEGFGGNTRIINRPRQTKSC
jgi:hypothetical protein